jgi:isopenicillin-N N-acyltransferase-like protein
MQAVPLPFLELKGSSPVALGHQHGESFREGVRELAEVRLERMCNLSQYKKPKEVLALAEEHLPILQKYDHDLWLEFKGLSEASNVDLARLAVLNNYTDMKDIPCPWASDQDLGGCSAIFAQGQTGPLLGQTWDIHGSAMPYSVALKVNNALVFSAMGCLGMTGINAHGNAILINNLSSIDAHVGLMWPAIVRKSLALPNAKAARDAILAAPLGSGHHYAVADEEDFFSIETSGEKKLVLQNKPIPIFIHTNHCLNPEMRKTHIINKGSSTIWRFDRLAEIIKEHTIDTPEKMLWALEEVNLPFNPKNPHQVATCGALVMDIKQKTMWACRGAPNKEMTSCLTTTFHLTA